MSDLSKHFDALADALGALPEAYNVTDHTDEQTTMLGGTPVEMIARALLATPEMAQILAEAWDEGYDEGWERGQWVDSQSMPGFNPYRRTT